MQSVLLPAPGKIPVVYPGKSRYHRLNAVLSQNITGPARHKEEPLP